MKIEVTKAKAYEIDPAKSYLVVYETGNQIVPEDADIIKTQIAKMFEELGATVQPAVVINGRLNITEIQDDEKAPENNT